VVNPFESGGVWLRCALHAHTTNSDGELPPEFLVRHYASAGFDVLAITDHWVRTDVPSTNGLLVLPSAELDATVEAGREAHVLALGITADPQRPEGVFPTITETVEWIAQANGVAFLAHPYWSGLRSGEFAKVDGLAGLEVYNGACELEVGRGFSRVHWDDVLEEGRPWLGIASDDCHHPGFDSELAWTWIHAGERCREAVLRALRDGAFYATSGPTIESVAVDGRAVHVRCSPAARVTLLAGRERGSSVTAGRLGYRARGEILERDATGLATAVRLVAPHHAPYARLEVKDAAGRTAWTNALWA
jgi:hypothetical protein